MEVKLDFFFFLKVGFNSLLSPSGGSWNCSIQKRHKLSSSSPTLAAIFDIAVERRAW